MIATRTKRLVLLLVVLTVVGVGYVAVRHLGAASLVGLGPYTVRMELVRTAGLVPGASVTYRGVEVGEVGDLRLTRLGVEVELRLGRRAPRVPASAIAVVANRSAAGEQYVDLQPPSDSAPWLGDGSVIPMGRTRLPVPVDKLLGDVNALATSIPTPQLRTTVDELFTAFDRTGPALTRLLDSSDALTADALRTLPQTTKLLRDGGVVLGTQADLAPQVAAIGRDLQRLGAQLRADDPALRRLAAAAPPAAEQLDALVGEVGPDLGRTLQNVLAVNDVVSARLPGVEQLLVTYPTAAAAASSVLPGDGRVHFGLVLDGAGAPPCRNGYLQPRAGWRPATDQELAPAATDARCNERPPVNPRGAQNAPAPDGGPGGYRPGIGAGTGSSSGSAAGTGPASTPRRSGAQNPPVGDTLAPVPASGVLARSTGGAPPIVIAGLTPPP